MHTSGIAQGVAQDAVWLVTGCSTGFGRELATQLLARGSSTIATARNPIDLEDLHLGTNGLVLPLDVTDFRQVDSAIELAYERFGRIDVLVNNAGIGYFGAIEESADDAVRRMFEINFFGLARMMRGVLPGMRKRRSGFIVNFSSIGGLCSFPSVGYYNATKYAVEGLSEALWQEVEPLGIKVMLVEPSGFRTDCAGRSAQDSPYLIDDYADTVGLWRARARATSGKQPGDPVRAARAIINAVGSENPPHRLLLGNLAFDSAMAKLEALRKNFLDWETVARGADDPTDPLPSQDSGPDVQHVR